MIRITGLHWESAYFCLSLIFGFILTDRTWKKILFILGVLISTSRTGILALAAVILFDVICKMSHPVVGTKHIKTKNIFPTMVFIIVVLCILAIFHNIISSSIMSNFERFSNMGNDASAYTHMLYYRLLFPIFTKHFTFKNVLFGIGPACSGYPFSKFYGIYSNMLNEPWTIENQLVNLLCGSGIVGTVLAYYWFIKKFRNNNELNRILIAVLIGSITYSYFVNWVWAVVYILSFSKSNHFLTE